MQCVCVQHRGEMEFCKIHEFFRLQIIPMSKCRLFLLIVLVLVIGVPISIKTEYTSYENVQNNFTIDVRHFGPETVLVEWEAGDETGITGYQIERRTDSSGFVKAGYVPAHGFDAGAAGFSYRFVDHPAERGRLYYRILQIREDGPGLYTYQKYNFTFEPQTNR